MIKPLISCILCCILSSHFKLKILHVWCIWKHSYVNPSGAASSAQCAFCKTTANYWKGAGGLWYSLALAGVLSPGSVACYCTHFSPVQLACAALCFCCCVCNTPQRNTAEWFQDRHLLIAHEQLFIRTIPCTGSLLMRAPFPHELQWSAEKCCPERLWKIGTVMKLDSKGEMFCRSCDVTGLMINTDFQRRIQTSCDKCIIFHYS